jgi:hypothetical protein
MQNMQNKHKKCDICKINAYDIQDGETFLDDEIYQHRKHSAWGQSNRNPQVDHHPWLRKICQT